MATPSQTLARRCLSWRPALLQPGFEGVPHKSGLVEPRTAWNPSPGSHHIQELDDSSTTFAMAELKEEARKRHIKQERRARKRRAKLKRKKELKKKLRGHTLAVQSIFRFERGVDAASQDKGEDNDLNNSVLSLKGGRVVRLLDGNKDPPSKTTKRNGNEFREDSTPDLLEGEASEKNMDDEGQEEKDPADSSESQNLVGVMAPGSALAVAESNAKNGAPDSVPSSPPKRRFSFANLSRKKSEGPTEEEIEAARRARLEAFRREQAEKVRKEMKLREAQWQKDWENMYHTRQKDVLPDGSQRRWAAAELILKPLAPEERESRKESTAKRDKEIMRTAEASDDEAQNRSTKVRTTP